MELNWADDTPAELPLDQFQLAKSWCRKRRVLQAEHHAAGSSLKQAVAKRRVSGRLASPKCQSLVL